MKILINGKLISPCNTKFEIVKDYNSTKAIIRGVVKEIIDIKLSRNEEKSSIQEFFDKYINSNNKSSKSLEYNGIVVKLSNNIKSYYGRVMKSLEIMKEGNEIKNFLDDNKVGGYLDKIHQIEEHLKSKPNDFVAKSDLSGEYINLGNEFSNLLDFEEAINSYEEAKKLSNEMLELHPDNNELKNDLAIIFVNLGKAFQNTGRYEEAIENYNEAKKIIQDLLILEPNNYSLKVDYAGLNVNMGLNLRLLGKYGEAIEKYEEAKKIYKEILKNDLGNDKDIKNSLSGVYLNLGGALGGLGKYEEAIANYEEAKKIYKEILKNDSENDRFKSNLVTICMNLGVAFNIIKEYEEAIKNYEEAKSIRKLQLKENPENESLKVELSKIEMNMGVALDNIGKYEEAIENYEEAKNKYEEILKKNPDNDSMKNDLASVYMNLGVSMRNIGRYEEAIEYYEYAKKTRQEILKKNPDNDSIKNDIASAYMNLGVSMRSIGRYEEAIENYEYAKMTRQEMLRKNPDNDSMKNDLARVYMNLGVAFNSLGKYEEAIKNYENVREIREKLLNKYPDNEGYKKQLGYLYVQLKNVYNQVGATTKANEIDNIFNKLGLSIEEVNSLEKYESNFTDVKPSKIIGDEYKSNMKKYKDTNINELLENPILIINNYDLYNILISLQTSHFLIFSGPSGTGKSTIIQKLAKHINGIDKNDKALGYLKVPIRSNYTDESSLLGYWNPLLSKYEGTETLEFLIDAYKNQTSPYFLLLDEMNLSRIENYFSDFLSRLDELKDKPESSKIYLFETIIDTTSKFKSIYNLLKSYDILGNNNFFSLNKGDYEINDGVRTINVEYKDGGYEKFFVGNEEIQSKDGKLKEIINFKFFIKLSKNLKVIGTINEDETTHSISNKVLDRAQFICFEVGDLFGNPSGESFNPPKDNIKMMNYEYKEYSYIIDNYGELFNHNVMNYSNNQEESISSIINDINNQIKLINSNESIGYRVIGDIGNYIKEFIDYENKNSFEGIEMALDYQLAQKVLTKIKSFSMINSQQITAFNKIGEILGYEKGKKIEEMKGYNSYPKTIKFYNYLYSNMIDE